MGLVSKKERDQIRSCFLDDADRLIELLEVRRRNTASDGGDQCKICDDDHKQWWYDNGYSESQRVAICEFLCPPRNG